MSRQLLVPDSVFCRQADPLPPVFPTPREGDIYFNTLRLVMRIFHIDDPENDPGGGKWRDLSDPDIQGYADDEVTVSDTDPVGLPPRDGVLWVKVGAGPSAPNSNGTFWVQWTGSAAEYAAIPEKDPNVLYVIV